MDGAISSSSSSWWGGWGPAVDKHTKKKAVASEEGHSFSVPFLSADTVHERTKRSGESTRENGDFAFLYVRLHRASEVAVARSLCALSNGDSIYTDPAEGHSPSRRSSSGGGGTQL